MIGYSLSQCIRDICMERVNESRVTMLVTGTKIETLADWEYVLDSYSRTYWVGFEERARKIANRLMATGMIFQPRVLGNPTPFIADGHWSRHLGDDKITV